MRALCVWGWLVLCGSVLATARYESFPAELRKWETAEVEELLSAYEANDINRGNLASLREHDKDVSDWAAGELRVIASLTDPPYEARTLQAYVAAEQAKRLQFSQRAAAILDENFNAAFSAVLTRRETALEQANRRVKETIRARDAARTNYEYNRHEEALKASPSLPISPAFASATSELARRIERLRSEENSRREREYLSLALLRPSSRPVRPRMTEPEPKIYETVTVQLPPEPPAPAEEGAAVTLASGEEPAEGGPAETPKPAPSGEPARGPSASAAPPAPRTRTETREIPFVWSAYQGKTVYQILSLDGEPVRDKRTLDLLTENLNRVLTGHESGLFSVTDRGELFYQERKLTATFVTKKTVKKKVKVVDRSRTVPTGTGAFQYPTVEKEVEETTSEPLDEKGQRLYAWHFKRRALDLWYRFTVEEHEAELARLDRLLEPFKEARPPRAPETIELEPSLRPEEAPTGLPFQLVDWFGRDLTRGGIVLVDWEGYLANPAFKVFIRPNDEVQSPMNVTFSASEPRLYFSNPSTVGARGPRKSLRMQTSTEWESFYISIWPDRDGDAEEYDLVIEYEEKKRIPLPQPPVPVAPVPVPAAPGVVAQGAPAVQPPQPPAPRYRVESTRKQTTVKIRVVDQDLRVPWGALPEVRPADPFPFLSQPRRTPFLVRPFPFVEEAFEAKDPWPFTITLDYLADHSEDYSSDGSSYFEDEAVRRVVQQAAEDWAYFIDEMPYQMLGAGSEVTEIQRSSANKDDKYQLENRYPFKDFLLYVTAANTLKKPHAQAGARGRTVDTMGSRATRLRRSGQVLLEGIHAQPGLSTEMSDESWWTFNYLPNEPGDLYSFLIHEVGHPLFAYPTYPNWATWSPSTSNSSGTEFKKVLDLNIIDYVGKVPEVDSGDHLPGLIDRASRKQGYGAIEKLGQPEKGIMPQKRWIITKADLLLMQEVGYRLRPTSAFVGMEMENRSLEVASLGANYSDGLAVRGGIPYYHWSVAAGELPPGLRIDSFTGRITGRPTARGTYHFVLRVRDYDNADGVGLAHATHITVR